MSVLTLDQSAADAIYRSLRLEDFFPDFPAEQAAKLFPRSALHLHPAGSHVIEQGDAGRDLYVLIEGLLAVTKTFGSAGAELARLEPGEVFGEMALLAEGMRTATVSAIQDSKVFRLAFEDMQYLLHNNRRLGEHLRLLAKRRREG